MCFRDYGVSEYLAKLIGVGFAALVAFLANRTLWLMIKRDSKRWVPRLAGVMAVWFAVMYAVSSPYDSSPYNPFSGRPGKYYRDQFDMIHKAHKGMKVGPAGETIQPFDRNSAQEYERQEGQPPQSWWQRLTGFQSQRQPSITESYDRYDNLVMWVEWVDLAPDRTILHLAVAGKDEKEGRLYSTERDGQTYLVDENHRVYSFWGEDLPEPYRKIRVDETYRYTTTFDSIAAARRLKFYQSRFKPLELDRLIARAHKIPPLTSVEKPKEIWVKHNSRYGDYCDIKIDEMVLVSKEVWLKGSCRASSNVEARWVQPQDRERTYLVDNQGRLSDLVADLVAEEPHSSIGRLVRPGEVFHFSLRFQQIAADAKILTMYLEHYPTIDVTEYFASRETKQQNN